MLQNTSVLLRMVQVAVIPTSVFPKTDWMDDHYAVNGKPTSATRKDNNPGARSSVAKHLAK